jgi:hypothetical protein
MIKLDRTVQRKIEDQIKTHFNPFECEYLGYGRFQSRYRIKRLDINSLDPHIYNAKLHNENGEIINTDFEFSAIFPYTHGYAVARVLATLEQDDYPIYKYGIIDIDGKCITKFVYDRISIKLDGIIIATLDGKKYENTLGRLIKGEPIESESDED